VHEPERLSPLLHRSGETILLRSPKLAVEERAFLSKLSIRGNPGDKAFMSRFRDVLGVEPPACGRAVDATGAIVLPLGPTQWLAVDRRMEAVEARPIAGRLRDRLVAANLIVVDVSSSTTILRVSGPGLHPKMRKLSALPLDRLPSGGVARTRMGRLAILVHALAPDRADLFVPRSFARSFFEQLQDAADPDR
jgi:heterotetrameric sarcosine oxidase gamma subunit